MPTTKKNIASYRLAAGMSQSQLAEASGVKLSTIQKLESGVNGIMGARLKIILPLAKALGVTIEELASECGDV